MKLNKRSLLILLCGVVLIGAGCGNGGASEKLDDVKTSEGTENNSQDSSITNTSDSSSQDSSSNESEASITEENETSSSNENGERKEIELTNSYSTKYGEANAITFPEFEFSYPENWTITEESATQDSENVVLKNNDTGAEIKYSHFGNLPKDFNFGTSTISMLHVDVTKVADSQFVPTYVQGTDYSTLGDFMVAELKVTGELDMRNESEFTPFDGSSSYAVIPEAMAGTREDVQGPFEGEFSFWYSSHISFVGNPSEEHTLDEEREIIEIMSSFKVVE